MKKGILLKKLLCVLLAMTITSTSFAIAFGQKNTNEKNVIEQNVTQVTETSASEEDEETENSGIEKEETVYVNLDPNGNIESQIVSSKLHSNEPNVVVNDKSDLEDIMPIKGGSLKKNKNGNLVWNIDEHDIYYRGKTERKMPMSVDIRYFLDGRQYNPEQLAGKSGKLEIRINVKNNESKIVDICGKPTKIYSPLSVMIGAIFKDDVFSNVEVDEGNVVSDGSNFVVSIMAMPGLSETLNIKNMSIDEIRDIEFHDSFVITADVKDFEMGPIAVVATPEFPDMDTEGNTIDDMRVDLIDLQDMQNDLQEMDGDHEIRSLFTDTEKSDAARLLIDDIFELYDLNRTILDVLPKYVTSDNVKVLENFIDDVELVDLDEIEDSEILDDLEKLLVKNDNPININDLKTMASKAKEYAVALEYLVKDINDENNDSKIEKLFSSIIELNEAVENCDPAVKTLFEGIIKDPNQLSAFIQGGLKAVLEGSKSLDTFDQMDSIASADVTLTEDTTSESEKTNTIDETSSDEKTSTDTDDTQKLPDESTDGSAETPTDNKEDTTTQPDQSGDTTLEDKDQTQDSGVDNKPADTEEQVDLGTETSDNKTEDTTESTDTSTETKTTDEKVDNISSEQTETTEDTSSKGDETTTSSGEEKVLAANTLDEMDSADVKQAGMPTPKDIQDELTKILPAFYGVLSSYDNLDDTQKTVIKGLLSNDTLLDLQNAFRYFEENKENIILAEKILNETDSQEVRRISRAISHLRENIDDFKPTLYKLQKDIKKPGMRESLRESPEMIRTLVKMNGDLEDNRNISDILKKAVSKENSEVLKDMIETLDRLIDENAIDGYVENVDDIKELLERKDALIELSTNQESYSGAEDSAETSVKFIMKTDEIKKPEPKKEKETVKEEPKSKVRQFLDKIFG